MILPGPFDEPFGPEAVPTTSEDVAALRRHRPVASDNWLDVLTALSNQFPGAAEALARRSTFAGMEPFSLEAADHEDGRPDGR